MAEIADAQWQPSLWRRLIALVRLPIILVVTLWVGLCLAIGKFVFKPAPQLARRWRVMWFNLWSRTMCATLGGRNIVHGEPPPAPFFLASNHLGYLDIVILAQYLPAVFVAKSEVKHWPFIGWLTRLADTLYIDRQRHRDIPRANQSIADSLAAGDSVVLFPEGTSSESDFVLPIRPPLLEVAVQQVVPVRTVALYFETHTTDPHAHDAICYYGDMNFVSHVWRLLHLRGFVVTIRFGTQAHFAETRHKLASQVGEEILALQMHNPPGIAARALTSESLSNSSN